MKPIIISIKNGVAEVMWRRGSEYALAEVDERYLQVGDEVAEHDLVYNSGGARFDELMARMTEES